MPEALAAPMVVALWAQLLAVKILAQRSCSPRRKDSKIFYQQERRLPNSDTFKMQLKCVLFALALGAASAFQARQLPAGSSRSGEH
jgi:hypothetical protein